MKAVVWTAYGPPEVLALREVAKPVPQDGELLIKILATTVTAGDCEKRRMDFPFYLSLPMRLWLGLLRPKESTIMGTELAGVVEATGNNARRFKVGDRVYGAMGMGLGTNAEYVTVPEQGGSTEASVAIMPANMSFEEAATVPFGARDALHFLRLGNIQPGQKLLINGAGGSIGTFAVQLAAIMGAEVTAVDSAPKLDMLQALGASHVIDYTTADFTRNGVVYDAIFDVVGTLSPADCAHSLAPQGVFLLANPLRGQATRGPWHRWRSDQRVVMQTASGTAADLDYLRELVEAGKLRTVIDRHYPLEEIVEAHRYVETGAKSGNVVITINHDQPSSAA